MTNKLVNRHSDKKRSPKKKSSLRNMIPKLPNFGAMFFGFLIGIFCSCLVVFMFSTSDITLKLPTVSTKKPMRVVQAKPASQAAAVQETRFEFYTELAKSPNQPERALDLKTESKTIHGYIVQAGTFKKAAEADAVRARLTLNGHNAKIDHIKHANGDMLHRVLLGTFKTEQQAKALQQKLKNISIDSVLVLKYTD